MRLWDLTACTFAGVLRGHTKGVWAVTFCPDARHVLSAGKDKDIRIWDTATGECVGVLAGHAGALRALAISPDGSTLLSGGREKAIRVWKGLGKS